jgi:hypothetical protein
MVEEYLTMIARRLPATNEEVDLLDEFLHATRTLEVRNVRREVWEQAITCGNELFDFLQTSNGAGITIDLEEGSLEWRPLSKAREPASHPNEFKRKTPSPFRRATGKYSLYILETKPEAVEVFSSLESGGLVNLGSKAEEWSINPTDNFRWHDLFHLSFFTVCGWSVVCKTMLGLDDETVPRSGIMGIRGAIMEEAIISRFFTEISSNTNPVEAAEIAATSALILCKGTKLSSIEKNSWKEALIRGHSLMTEAVKLGGGTINIDLEAKSIEFLRN